MSRDLLYIYKIIYEALNPNASINMFYKQVIFIIYTLTLQYMLNNYNVLYHFYADDTLIYFKLDSKDPCVSKLNSVLNAVQTWMLKKAKVE